MKPVTIEYSDIEKQFEFVDTLINRHLDRAVQNINTEMLYTYWEVGQYISERLKSSAWGDKVVADLADYLKRRNPKRRGYSKRNLYNMISFYDTYSTKDFTKFVSSLPLPEFVQLATAQLEPNNEIVQLTTAQFPNITFTPVPQLLTIITFTNHVEILNRCDSYEERIFYMLYAYTNRLKTEELRSCIVSQTFETVMSKEKKFSPALLQNYPDATFMLKDKAFLDFLNLPQKHNEHKLHKELLNHMKEFILELGKDFLFIDSEYSVQVGGSSKRIDLLFYHRGLQCLVAVELKAVDFEPEFVGKMDMYLEALDRDVKRDNENPSIGIILCPSADKSVVEYTLSRSLSPTMVAEYKRKLIPQDVLKRSLDEYCSFLNMHKIEK
ncbi:MAG: DUF1016 family protein [Bacteroidales bacterium]|nr:DUF1016 family protein [Bacteroidales bacterium]